MVHALLHATSVPAFAAGTEAAPKFCAFFAVRIFGAGVMRLNGIVTCSPVNIDLNDGRVLRRSNHVLNRRLRVFGNDVLWLPARLFFDRQTPQEPSKRIRWLVSKSLCPERSVGRAQNI